LTSSSFPFGLYDELKTLCYATLLICPTEDDGRHLGLDVAVITAFQLTRIFIFMPNIPLLIRIVNKWETHRKRHKK